MHIALGDFHIHKLVEIDRMCVPPTMVFAGADAQFMQCARTRLDARMLGPDGNTIAVSFHSYVLRANGMNILIDTCNGNHKPRDGFAVFANQLHTDYLGGLARLGLRPGDIDVVFCTHLHFDHIGWNTMLRDGRWVPTFPNARYLMNRVEFDHFNLMLRRHPEFPGIRSIEDSITPVVAAGLAEFADLSNGFELGRGIRLELAPGHTPGCAILYAEDRGGRAVFTGDVVHHAIQLLDPRLHVNGEYDPQMGIQSRINLLNACADQDIFVLTAHFTTPTAGRVTTGREQPYDFVFHDD